ncbi:hypothetical protein PCANC_07875 [Puccinia coronata f. sp. avenae]|uniref:Uncharacterized protein n=1 Tax=Puccinia coronata f. sp. avenae TaxID=200324 RepID=A0A2N5UN13_9BASI|nr:hypothetical protein PCASD_07627 [Puccinia coronata f. sp. avenae]PLW47864.1 hypothetical protein PCANC_07875 [Puccinia coronata f. sp. avenae]
MEAVAAVTTAHTVEADESIFAPRCITDIDLLKLEDSPKIHKDYLQAENRLIFIGDVKPFTKNDHQARFNTTLSILAADRKNDI